MEGTRHEKIVLILAAYVIGFTTAFIAFGVNKISDTEVTYNSNVEPIAVDALEEEVVVTDGITSIGFGKDGLFAVTSGYERLLSADKNAFTASVASSVDGLPGFYYNIIDAEISRNGRFVYFCEQNSAEAEYCSPYVYSLDDDSVHAVKVDGEAYKAPVASHESIWSDGNNLVLNGMVSVDNQSPWIFVTNSEETVEAENIEADTASPEVQ